MIIADLDGELLDRALDDAISALRYRAEKIREVAPDTEEYRVRRDEHHRHAEALRSLRDQLRAEQ